MAQQQNLKVSYQFVEFILKSNRCIMGHLYSFTNLAGETDYFTDMDIDINWMNQIWKSGSLRIAGLKRKLSIGLSVDEQEMTIWALPSDTIWGGNFLQNAEAGALDGCLIKRYRLIWPLLTGNALFDVVTNSPLAGFLLFSGYMAGVKAGGVTHVTMSVKSPLVKLDVNMPRNYYQPGCLHTLFDSGCTLVQSAFAVSGVVGSGATDLVIPVVGGLTNLGADGIAQYAQGRVSFTSGANDGVLTLAQSNDAANLYLAYPLEEIPSAGDTITFYPGCSKSFDTCGEKYSNTQNFRGYDKVPPVVISM